MKTTPPRIKAHATGVGASGSRKWSFSIITPPTAVMPKAIPIIAHNRLLAGSRHCLSCAIRGPKRGITAKTAPDWIEILKRSLCLGNQCSAIRRCPVEETGMNSVRPSTTPKSTAVSQAGRSITVKRMRGEPRLLKVLRGRALQCESGSRLRFRARTPCRRRFYRYAPPSQ